MIKCLAGVLTAAIVPGPRSRRAGRVAPAPTVLVRASLAIAASTALAAIASAVPAQAKVLGLGGQAATGAVLAHSSAAGSGPGWSITPSPNPNAANGLLNAVSCPATSVCMAVGLHVRASGLGVTLAERRSGGVWAVQSTPNPYGAAASALNGVSCPSGSACTAVGQFAVKSGPQLSLAERWNGRNWHIQPTPNPARSPSSSLSAVACPATDSCTAVGSSNSKLLVEQWGGPRWRIQSAPEPHGAQFSELNGVACAAAASCIAVGDYVTGSGAQVTLAERWNGSTWAIQPTPNPSGAQSSVLFSVSCTGPGACEAVGLSDAGIFAERWDGTSWSVQAVPAPAAAQFALLFTVSCAASSCEAVGFYQDSSGAFVPLGERWNGAAWRAQPVPNPARASTNILNGVSCPASSDCTAVGMGNGNGTPITLGERWNGTRWNLQAVPSPVGAAENQLNGIACPATNACAAVGALTDSFGNAFFGTLAERWNGRSWHIQPTPVLPGLGLVNNFTAACPAPSTCIAAGGFENDGPGAKTLTEQWRAGASAAQPAPGAFSPRAYRGMAGCIRAAMGAGSAVGTTTSRIEPKIRTPIPPRSQSGSEIERIISLCGAA